MGSQILVTKVDKLNGAVQHIELISPLIERMTYFIQVECWEIKLTLLSNMITPMVHFEKCPIHIAVNMFYDILSDSRLLVSQKN